MDIRVSHNGSSVSMHADVDTHTEVKAFPQDSGEHGNPPFVCLTLSEGDFPHRQDVRVYLSPEMAAQLGGELSLASAEAICPE